MRFNSVGFALSVGMALIVVLIGFTLLSAAGLVGFAAANANGPEPVEEVIISSVEMPDRLTSTEKLASLPAAESKKVVAGEALFRGNCAQCHAVNERGVGPALAGITKRRPISWLIPWVKNSSKVVVSGDEYAVALFNKYNKQQMPSFALSDSEIESIMAYVIFQEEPSIPTSGAVASR